MRGITRREIMFNTAVAGGGVGAAGKKANTKRVQPGQW